MMGLHCGSTGNALETLADSDLGALSVGSGLPMVEMQCHGDGMVAGGDGAVNRPRKASPRAPSKSGPRSVRSQGIVPLYEASPGAHKGNI